MADLMIAHVTRIEPFHFGEWLRGALSDRGKKIVAVAFDLGVSKNALHTWLRRQHHNIEDYNRGRLAATLGITRAEIDARLEAAEQKLSPAATEAAVRMILQARRVIDTSNNESRRIGWNAAESAVKALTGKRIEELPRAQVEFDQNVRAYFDAVKAVRLYKRNLAAGHWIEPVGMDDQKPDEWIPGPPLPGLDLARVIAVMISGDSMEPKYPDGAIVYFYLLRIGTDLLRPECDYYVQKSDDTATFKQLVEFRDGGETLRLKARNTRKIKGFVDVAWQEISRIAEAIGRYLPADGNQC
jgi:hypothetical protein